MDFTPRKDQVGNKLSRFKEFNKKLFVPKCMCNLCFFKMKMQKIGHESLSLHIPLIN